MTVGVGTIPQDLVQPRVADGLRVVSLRGRTLIGTAWVDYLEGGDLTYHEFLVAVPVLQRRRRPWRLGLPAVTILDIWVDSPPSRDGGRVLWGIPKELATFPSFSRERFAMTLAELALPAARARWRPGVRLPGRWPFALAVVQALRGQLTTTGVRARGAIRTGRLESCIDPQGPLAYLDSARPLLAVRLDGVRMRFGV